VGQQTRSILDNVGSELVKLILFLKMYLGGGQVSSIQTVGSILIPLVGKGKMT
jgi:hypothetical protein